MELLRNNRKTFQTKYLVGIDNRANRSIPLSVKDKLLFVMLYLGRGYMIYKYQRLANLQIGETTLRPIKVCMTAWLAVGTPDGTAYIVPTRNIYLCIALDLCSEVPTFKTTKNKALANTFLKCSAPSL